MLRAELGIGAHLLEGDGASRGVETVYALTREGVRKIFEAIEKKEQKEQKEKACRPKKSEIRPSVPAKDAHLSGPVGWGKLQYGKHSSR